MSEIVVVGGGPAGSALAAALARKGRDALLLEKDVFPRHKLCGEFLSAESRRLLEDVGCLKEILALDPVRITRGRFFSPKGRYGEFDLKGEALGVSRWALDEALFRHAGRSGATTREGARVVRVETAADGASVEVEGKDGAREEISARLVVAAYGRRSPLDARLGRRTRGAAGGALGFKRHHRPADTEAGRRLFAELGDTVEIHLFAGGYCGLSRVEGGRVNVCFLLENNFLRERAAFRWDDICAALGAASASLRERLRALVAAEEGFHSVAGLGFSARETSRGRVFFIGDAAGMITPLCGDGQAMALESASRLAEMIAACPARWEERDVASLRANWEADWRGRFSRRLRLGRLLQASVLRAPVGEVAVGLLAKFPSLGSALAGATRSAF